MLYSLRVNGEISAWSPEQNRTLLRSRIPAKFGTFSPDVSRVAYTVSNDIRIADVATGDVQVSLIALRDGGTYFITPDGRTTIGEDFDDSFVYVTLTDKGQETLGSKNLKPASKWNTTPFGVDLLDSAPN